jgi:hypothetical protein
MPVAYGVFFARQREMDREKYKEKRDEERAQKHEKSTTCE